MSKTIEQFKQDIENAATDKEKALAYANRGIQYSELEQHEKAVADFTDAIELYKDDNEKTKAYYNRNNLMSTLTRINKSG